MKHVRNLLITTAILAAVCLTGCKPAPEPAATAPQYVTVEAPESPYAFAPLQMFVFPDRDFPITKYGARPGDIAANSAAFA